MSVHTLVQNETPHRTQVSRPADQSIPATQETAQADLHSEQEPGAVADGMMMAPLQAGVEGSMTGNVDIAAAPMMPVIETTDMQMMEGEGEEEALEMKPGEDVEVAPEGDAGADEEEQIIETPKRPEDDPAFQKVIKYTEKTEEQQKHHQPAEDKLGEVKNAAKLPVDEQTKKNDQLGHIASMDATAQQEKKREPFTPKGFKDLLQSNLDDLEDELPTNESSAKKFKREKPIEKVKENIAGQVKSENEKISGPLVKQAKQEPPASDVPAEEAVEIPDETVGNTPEPLNKTAAVPKPMHPTEVSMEKESQSLDEYMDENEVTEDQLARSNQPEFIEALDSKTQAQEAAADAPNQYRAKESRILNKAKYGVGQEGEKGFGGMFDQRQTIFESVLTTQTTSKDSDKDQQNEIFKKLEKIYNDTKEKVSTKLEDLSEKVDDKFSTKAEQAKKTFESNVEKKLDDIYGFTVIDDWLFGEDTEAIEKAFKTEKGKFISTMNGVLDEIAKLIADTLNKALEDIEEGKKASKEFFEGLDKEQQKLAQDAFDDFNDQYESLEDTVYDTQQELAQDLARSYKDNVDSLRESFDEIKERVSAGWIGAAFNFLVGVIKTILEIKDLLFNLLSAAIDAIGAILSDPIGFLSNLFSGIKMGFENFFKNIKKNIITGLIEWLTGSLGNVGIKVPDDLFSLGGIFDLVAQILGLTWDYFRSKAVKLLGETTVQAMETGFEMFQIIREKGVMGLWEHIKEQFADLKEMVIDAIRDMIITKVVEAGIKWIMGLMSPVGAFVKAAMMIIDIVKFFIERAAQIIDLVNAFIEGIRALANGNVKDVANAIEKALVKAIPILIGFLASLIGVTGLTAKVQKIIGKVRKKIDRAITKIIKKAKKAFMKLVKTGKKKVKGAAAKLLSWWKHKKKFKDKNNQEHTLYFEGSGNSSVLMMKSVKKQVIKHIRAHQSDPNTKQKAVEAESTYNRFVAAKKVVLKAGKTPEQTKIDAERLLELVNELSLKLRELPGDFSPVDYPTAADIQFISDGNRPTNVKSHYLTDLVQYGSAPGDGTGVTGWSEIKRLELTKHPDDGWIQFHLINDHLGGKGEPNNLVPTPNSINKAYQKFENKTHALVFKSESRKTNKNAPNDKNVVWMHVMVRYYKGDLSAFAQEIEASSGIYHYRPKEGKANLKEKWIQDSKPVFSVKLQNPNPYLMVSGVNLNQSGEQQLRTFFDDKEIDISNSFIKEIINNRAYAGKTGFTETMLRVMANRTIDDRPKKDIDENQLRIKIREILYYFNNKLDSK